MSPPSIPALLQAARQTAGAQWAALLARADGRWDIPAQEGLSDSDCEALLAAASALWPVQPLEAGSAQFVPPQPGAEPLRAGAVLVPSNDTEAVLLLGPASASPVPAPVAGALGGIAAAVVGLLHAEQLLIQARQSHADAAMLSEARRRADELALMSRVGQSIVGTLDMDELLRRLMAEIRRVVEAEAASILLWDEDEQALTFATADSPHAADLVGLRVPAGQGIAGWVAQNREPLLVNDVRADPRWYPRVDEAIAFQSRSVACVPILRAEQLVGVLEAVNKAAGEFSRQDVQLLEALSIWAGEAISNVRAFQAQQRQRQTAESLAQLTAIAAATLDLPQVLARVLEQMARLVKCDLAWIALRAGDEMRVLAVHPPSRRAATVGRRFSLGAERGTEEMLRTRRPARLAAEAGRPARLVVPLAIGERLIGQIAFDRVAPDFTPAEAGEVAGLGQPAATAIENAQLYAEATRRLQEMTILQEVALATSLTLDPDELLRRTAQTLYHSMNYERVIVLLTTAEGRLRLHPASTGLPVEEIRPEIELGQGAAGMAALAGQPQRLEDAAGDPHFTPLAPSSQARSQLAVPLLAGERVSGVLALESTRPAAFGPEDERLLTIVARQLANALRSAALYADVQARIAELRQAQDQLVQSEKFAAIGRLTASIAHEVNNPLQSIHNCLRLAAEARLAAERRGEYLDMAEAELLRLMEIVRRMLEYYRPAASERLPASVNALVEDVLALAGKQARDQGVEVIRDFGLGLPPVRVVANHIRQVFLNLLLNGVEAMPGGGRMRIRSSRSGDEVLVRFEDSGHGLAPGDLDQIFEPFYTTKAKGTGLGLSVSYGIVAAHGGRIDVESEPGRGAAFTVRLPVGEG